jgi:selenocysteine lyase/cysteine desulfurase
MELSTARKLWDPAPGWLNTASYGLPPRPAFDELQAVLDEWRTGRVSWEGWDLATRRSRVAFAGLVGVDPGDVAVGSAVSQLLAPIGASLPTGTRVLVPDIEFTSNLFPWLAAPGVEVDTVAVGELADRIDAGTDVVAFSVVQSATGEIADVDAVVGAARAHGALVVADATQACGWLPVEAGRFDAVVVGAYKWLMCPRGTAFAYLAPDLRERLTPYAAGWYAGEDVHDSYYGPPLRLATSARRFDISPSWVVYAGAPAALELVAEIGVTAIHDHDVALANRFLTALGRPPGDSAIVTVDAPGADEKLRKAGVRAAVRAGRVRASFHLYTTEADVDQAVNALV